MLEFLKSIDYQLFTFVNSYNSIFFDEVMTAISGQILWLPYFALIIYFLIFKNKLKNKWYGLLGLLFLVAAIGIADFSSVHLFKDNFTRLRPCHNQLFVDTVHLVDEHCGGQYGFVSSHSANFFSLAVFSSFFIKRKLFIFLSFFFAIIVAYSRVYLGVHFPADVVCGGLWGMFIGSIFYYLFIILSKKLFKQL